MMTDSATHDLSCDHHYSDDREEAKLLLEQPEPEEAAKIEIPVEIISEEEMALIEAAFLAAAAAAARPSLTPSVTSCSSTSFSLLSSQFQRSIKRSESISKKGMCSVSAVDGEQSAPISDIEDSGRRTLSPRRKKGRLDVSLLSRFRKKRALSATDLTGSEWCEKQMEFKLCLGKIKVSEAMKAGIARHAKLEEEVMTRVEVHVKSKEDIWALKLINFIAGVNQLLFEGLTRELPIVGHVDGVWMVGVIDELRMPMAGIVKRPTFVDTKTRVRATLPEEPQQRNGRLQLMIYRHLWDSLSTETFTQSMFYEFFSLDPHHSLSEEIKNITSDSGYSAKTLDDLMQYFRNVCSMLPSADDHLLLRYELQKDNSLLGEDLFSYDAKWLKDKLRNSLEFWHGKRAASYVPEEERWKCRWCQYASVCPSQNEKDTPL